MGKQDFQPEQINDKLREVVILLSNGQSVQTAIHQIGVTEQIILTLAQRMWRHEGR
jgi:hypothetical protein